MSDERGLGKNPFNHILIIMTWFACDLGCIDVDVISMSMVRYGGVRVMRLMPSSCLDFVCIHVKEYLAMCVCWL